MNAEQQEELEVLSSIFPDTFTELSQSPPEWQVQIDSDMLTLLLRVVLPSSYPYEIPEIRLECSRGKYADLEKLQADLVDEANRGLGLAMVFSLVNLIEERLAEHVKSLKLLEKSKEPPKKVSYNEIRKFEGTPVTLERFHEWNAKFMREMEGKRAIEEQKRKAELGNKLTGRQLFEMNKATAASDNAFYDEGGVCIDEAVFEGLEDLDLDGIDEKISQEE